MVSRRQEGTSWGKRFYNLFLVMAALKVIRWKTYISTKLLCVHILSTL